MRTLSHICLISIALFFSTCKKEPLPATVVGDPVFFVKAKVSNGTYSADINLQAGNDGVFMRASHSQNADNLYVFRADLAPTCTSQCNNYSVSVMFNDVVYRAPGAKTDVNAALQPGNYLLMDQSKAPKEQTIRLVPQMAYAGLTSYSWTIDDGESKVTATTFTTTQQFDIGKTYTVTFTSSDDQGGCQSQHSNVITVGGPFQVVMSADQMEKPEKYTFTANPDKEDTYTYAWDFGDGNFGSGKVCEHTYAYTPGAPFKVKLVTTNSKGKSCTTYYQVSASSNPCEANFSTQFEPLDMSYLFKTITILVFDPLTGKTYSSADVTQNINAKVTVSSVTNYISNGNLEPTKKIEMTFDCVVKNGSEQLVLTDGLATLAVSYP